MRLNGGLRRRLATLILVAGISTAGLALQLSVGQSESFEHRIVNDVRFPNLSSTVIQQRLRALLPIQPGAPLTRESIRQSIQRLHATDRFADIRAETDLTPDGQIIISFITQPNFFIASVDVVGLPSRPTKGQVIDASKLELGELFNRDRIERAIANVQRLMEENGYNRASLETTEQTDAERQQVAIVFVIHPGTQARVGEITVSGNAGYSTAQIQRLARFRTGDRVSVQHVSDALDRLRKKYQKQNRLLAQVSIVSKLYRPETDRVDYHLDIEPGPKVEILSEGFKIRRSVLRQNVPVFEENAVDDDLLNEGRRNLLNYLQSRGYFEATVAMRKVTAANGTDLQIVYTIDAKNHHKLVKIEIKGNKFFRTEDLRSRMRVQASGHLMEPGRFSQALLTTDIRGFEQLYRANGFENVKITSNVVDNYAGRQSNLAVEIEINEGLQTLVGAFHMEGDRSFPESQLRALVSTAQGQAFSEAYIAQDRDDLLNFYFNHGFPRATFEASAKPIEGDPKRMDVTFTIHEGDQVFVDQSYVSGTYYTKPFVVTRELQIHRGTPLSQLDMLESQRRLYDLGIFNQVDTAVQNPNGAESQKDVLVHVQEAKRYTFNYGIGLEFQTGQPSAIGTNQALGQTGVSGRASLDVTRLNFRGRDHTITFKGDVGSLQQRGLISYNAPRWFSSPDWKLSFTGFYDNTLDVTTFTSQRLEGSVQAEQTISKASTIDYRFVYRRVKATNIEISEDEIPLLSLPVRVGGPGFSYIRNQRDNDLESTKGSYTTVDTAFAAGFFGSEADFSRILVQNSTYHAFGKNRPREKKFVFARSLRVGVESTFGSTVILPPGQACADATQSTCPGESVIPLAERFFSGGGNSHRGFGLNQAGPRDPTTGFPLGGSALFVNNFELRFPPANLPFVQDNISFAVFWDAGNVFTDGRTMLDNLLRWKQKDPQNCLQEEAANPNSSEPCNFSYVSHAIGLGVRYKTPIGPVRFDFGYNLNPPAFPSCQETPSITGQAASPICEANTKNSSGVPTLPYFVPQHASHFNVYFSIGQSF